MIGVLSLILAQAPVPPITTQPLPKPQPLSKPRYEVKCELRDLDMERAGQISLVQSGGVYGLTNGGLPSRSRTAVRFIQDDFGIFGSEEFELFGGLYTEWHSDGPIELVAKNGAGSMTIDKTTKNQAWFGSPTKIAVTVKGGRRVRSKYPDRTWEEFLLVGVCDVAWKAQSVDVSSQDRVKS